MAGSAGGIRANLRLNIRQSHFSYYFCNVLILLSFLPRVILSHLFGFFTRIGHPALLSRLSIRLFLWCFPQISTEEMVKPPLAYPTLNAFFTRVLKPDARLIATAPVTSPCDGTFGQSGIIEKGLLLQAKGITYPLEDFLAAPGTDDGRPTVIADPKHAGAYEGGAFVTIYLAPYNYHRVHAPVAGKMVSAGHVGGDLWPVFPQAVLKVKRLFCLNERTWIEQRTSSGKVLTCMVGAMNVGHITLSHDRAFGRDEGAQQRPENHPLEKGQEIGIFELGSTVVLLLDAEARAAWAGSFPEAGTAVRMGQPIFSK